MSNSSRFEKGSKGVKSTFDLYQVSLHRAVSKQRNVDRFPCFELCIDIITQQSAGLSKVLVSHFQQPKYEGHGDIF